MNALIFIRCSESASVVVDDDGDAAVDSDEIKRTKLISCSQCRTQHRSAKFEAFHSFMSFFYFYFFAWC